MAIVTGAARGLGRAVAARLRERGVSVAVNVRDEERAAAAARDLGDDVLPVAGDVAVAGVPEAIVNLTLDRFGRVDILVNNAALPMTTRVERISPEESRQVGRLPGGRRAPIAAGAEPLPRPRSLLYIDGADVGIGAQ